MFNINVKAPFFIMQDALHLNIQFAILCELVKLRETINEMRAEEE